MAETTQTGNYRPISIISALSKILERAVQSQLIEYLEKNKLLSESQYGYRGNRSTELAAALLLDNIRKNVDKGNMIGAVFVDLSKAFATIGHAILLQKLESYGINNVELDWFTEKNPVTCGVPQGSILGPLLFLISFNDFSECLVHSKVIKFADDAVIYFANKDFHLIERNLNEDLNKISTFMRENELIVNTKKGKTEVMLFGTAKKLNKCDRNLKVLYNWNEINQTTRYKYLGSTIDPSLNLSDNFDKMYKKASTRLRLLESLKYCLTSVARKRV